MERYSSGYLKIILGPMFAGKTTELIRIFNTHAKYDRDNIAVINYGMDTRYANKEGVRYIVTHDNNKLLSLSYISLLDFVTEVNVSKYNTILINEGQFFKDLYVAVDMLVNKFNKKVYVCGLDGDFKRQKFGDILDLISISDDVVKLKSICSKCREAAIFTHRKISQGEQTVIGDNIYEPLCRKCYNNINKSKMIGTK
jgi:thymidine kinase